MWEETDGLDPNDFDPKTFFKLHGNRFDTILIFISFVWKIIDALLLIDFCQGLLIESYW